LWVLNDAEEDRAKALIDELVQSGEATRSEDWVCPKCGTTLEAAFTDCWKCSGSNGPDP